MRRKNRRSRFISRAATVVCEQLEFRQLLSTVTVAPTPIQLGGLDPSSIAIGDFNGDGVNDFVTGNTNNPSISVFFGNANGTFKSPVTITGINPDAVAIGDFNGDGRSDIVVVNTNSPGSIDVFLGNANGTFTPARSYAVGSTPRGVVVADFNNDGHPDIAVANYSSGTVSILLGNGDGTFAPARSFVAGKDDSAIAAGDFNGDGKLDLVVSNTYFGGVTVLLGCGDGTFGAGNFISVAYSSAVDVAVADINKDGKADIVVADHSESQIFLLPGCGDGTFGPNQSIGFASSVYHLAIADFSGDGFPDIVATVNGGVDVFISSQGNSFSSEFYSLQGSGAGVAVGDLNHDGKLDVAATSDNDSSVRILAGNGAGNFTPQPAPLFTGFAPKILASADLNGDGKPDLVAMTSDAAVVLLSNGDSTFKQGQVIYLPNSPTDIVLGDINGDHKADLIVSSLFGYVTVFFGNGDGTFNPAPHITSGAGSSAYALQVADVNNDGKLDVVEGSSNTTAVTVLFGNGDGTFKQPLELEGGYHVPSLAIADLNGDGKLDIVDVSYNNSIVSVFLNNGSNTFLPARNYSAYGSPNAVVIGDFNKDGIPDIAYASSGHVGVLFGNGNGTFTSAENVPTYGNAKSLVETDYDGDGNPDLVESTTSSSVNFLLGNSNGSFQPVQTFFTTGQGNNLVVGDFNGDGKPDLANALPYNGEIQLLQDDLPASLPYSPVSQSLRVSTDPTFRTTTVQGATQYRFLVATNPADLPVNPSATSGGASVVVDGVSSSSTFTPASNLNQGTTYYWEVNATNGQTNGVFSAIQVFTTAAANLPAPTLTFPTNAAVNQPSQFAFTWTAVPGATEYEFALGTIADELPSANNSGFTTIDKTLGNVTSFTPTQALMGGTQYFWEVRALNDNANGNFSSISSFTTAAAAISLKNGVFHAGGLNPSSVAIGDFNNDGHLDYVTADSASDSLSLFLGNGDGTFQLPITIPVPYNAAEIVAANLNGDGNLDIVALGYSGMFSLLGNGNGTFKASKTTFISGSATSLAAGDLNGDGSPDVVIGEGGSGVIDVFIGNGDGTFKSGQSFTLGSGSGSITAVALADVNGDGTLDLVATMTDYGIGGRLFVVPGLGNGSLNYTAAQTYSAGNYARGVTVADLNGDGKPDIAVANEAYQGYVSVFFANQTSGFAPATTFSAGRESHAIAVANYNGAKSLFVADETGVGVLAGYGSGTFGTIKYASEVYPQAFAVADFNGDGTTDVVTANGGLDSTTVVLGQPGGSFTLIGNLPTGVMPSHILSGDFNGDGKQDLIAVGGTNNNTVIATLLGNGDGTFKIGSFTNIPSYGVSQVLTGDFNGDGIPDLVVIDKQGVVYTLLGNTNGTFHSPFVSAFLSSRLANTTNSAAVGDINHDGKADLVVSLYSGDVEPLINNGDGTFQVGSDITTTDSNGAALAFGDFNNDGYPDLVVVNQTAQQAMVLLNNQTGGFNSPLTITVGDAPASVIVGDVNNDLNADIVVANYGDGTVTVVRGNGDGTFKNAKVFSAGVYSDAGLALADINGDGKVDIITADAYHGTVVALLGNGNGTFLPATFLGNGDTHARFVVSDLKGDGHPDVIVTGSYATDLTLLSQPLAAPTLIAPAANATAQSSTPTFSWSAVPGATEYILLAATNTATLLTGSAPLPAAESTSPFVIEQMMLTGTSFTPIQALSNNTVIYWEVEAFNPGQNGVWSAINSFTVGAPPVPFTSSQLTLGGSVPSGVVTGDFNKDGHLDVVTVNQGNGTLSILLGNGNGTFKPAQLITGVAQNSQIFAADINGDGKLDLITLSPSYYTGSAEVSIFLGNGDGTFKPPTSIALPNTTRTIAVGDVNGDSKPDIVAVDRSSQPTFSVLINNGGGTFLPPTTFTGTQSASALAIGDVNGDGKADIVTAGGYSSSGTIQIFDGAGNGTFAPPLTYSSYSPRGVTLADVNKDGKLDIVTSKDTSGGGFAVLLNNGNGTFPTSPTYYPVGRYPGIPVVADVNGDGNPDIIIPDGTAIEVFQGRNNHLGFKAAQILQTGIPYLRNLVVADFNGDGVADIIAPSITGNSVVFYVGNNTGAFQFSSNSSIGYLPASLVTTDVNGDGVPDLILGDARGSVVLFPGKLSGGFASPIPIAVVGSDLSLIGTADFNGDGNADIITLCNNAGQYQIDVLFGSGGGVFSSPTLVANVYGKTFAVGDVNGDGLPDIVYPSAPSTISIVDCNKNNTFTAPAAFSLSSNATVNSICVADLNGDGKADIVVGQSDGTLDVLITNAARAQSYSLGSCIGGVAVGDFNQDGKPDIVASVPTSNTLDLLLGLGGGSFGMPQSINAGVYAPQTVRVADFNNDGHLDIFVTAGFNSEIGASRKTESIVLGNGDGSFQAPQGLYTAGVSSYSGLGLAGVSDVNGDGTPDIYSVNRYGASINFLINSTQLSTLSAPVQQTPANNATNQVKRPTFTWTAVTGATSYRIFIATKASDLPTNPAATTGGATVVVNTTTTSTSFRPATPLNVSTTYFWEVIGTAGTRGGTFSSVFKFTTGTGIPNAAPAITNPTTAISFNANSPGNFGITTSGSPTAALSVTGNLPSGVTFIDNGNGTATISGTPTLGSGGIYNLTVTANNGVTPNATQTFTLTVLQAPAITSGNSTTITAGTASTFNISTTGFPAPSFTESGPLPTGITFVDNANGTAALSGTAGPLTGGVYTFTITAASTAGSVSQTFTLTDMAAPVFTNSASATFATGIVNTFTFTTSASPVPAISLQTPLPAGLAFQDNGNGTATLSGMPTTPGMTTLSLSASNGIAPIGQQSFTLTVAAPTITQTNTGAVMVGGTGANDIGTVTVTATQIVVNIDNTTMTFMTNSVNGVNINLGGGNSNITLGAGVPAVSIAGSTGSDTLMGLNHAADTLKAGSGNAIVVGGGPGSSLKGGAGFDILEPTSNKETVTGGSGSDTIVGAGNRDLLRGGAGRDLFLDGNTNADTLIGGSGLNFAQYNPADMQVNIFEVIDPQPPPTSLAPAVSAALAAVAPSVSPAVLTLPTAIVTNGTLSIQGTVNSDVISLATNPADTKIVITADSVRLTAFNIVGLSAISVTGGQGRDSISVADNITLPTTLAGNVGPDTLIGGGGENVLIGGKGSDSIVGGPNTNDLIPYGLQFTYGSIGNDTLDGGTGYSYADFSRRTDPMALTNDGKPDSGGAGETTQIDTDVSAILAGTSNDTIVGRSASDFLSGGYGANVVRGRKANDILVGGKGNDSVAVGAEPVAIYLNNGFPNQYMGVLNPIEDILDIGSSDVSVTTFT